MTRAVGPFRVSWWWLAAALLSGATPRTDPQVDDRMLGDAADTAQWLSYGRTHDEQRFVPLSDIDRDSVARLGLAWAAELDTDRGQEATPLVIDGSLYVSTAWSKVKAYDARTGQALWSYDPEVPGRAAANACCDVVNRGLAAWGDALFVATLDGRLVSLDRRSGAVRWVVATVDPAKPYTVTGAPRAIGGLIVIGNGGADYGVRGYVSAYDARTGALRWRFYTVPDRPGSNVASHLKLAERSWTGEWWKLGGGGTVWDAMAYDPKLGLLYIGVGNGSPWNQAIRSPGGGDNLFLSSIVAVRAATGEYVWHYQTTPGETWDYTATQHIMLAELTIGGRRREVLMQAPKNGFFYVIDRRTGELLSADNFVPVTWASHIDMASGRPVELPAARWDRTGEPALVAPGPSGAHSWQPMAFDPASGLVFIPAMNTVHPFLAEKGWQPRARGFNTGLDGAAAAMPANAAARRAAARMTTGALIAWDPAAQRERWRVPLPGPWNGGVLATAGGLVFQGNAQGELAAYDSATGRKRWAYPAGTGVIAPPISYRIGGTQYIAVMAGWGGSWPLAAGALADVAGPVRNRSRLLVFRLGGSTPPPVEPIEAEPLAAVPVVGTAAGQQTGATAFARYCSNCHGNAAVGGGVVPDLRRSAAVRDGALWQQIVHEGLLADRGMASFADVMTVEEIAAVRSYVALRTNEDAALAAPLR